MAFIKTTIDPVTNQAIEAYWDFEIGVIEKNAPGRFQLKPFANKLLRDSGAPPIGGESNYRPYQIPEEVILNALQTNDLPAWTKLHVWVRDYVKEVLKAGYVHFPGGILSEPDENGDIQVLGYYQDTASNIVSEADAHESFFAGCEIVE